MLDLRGEVVTWQQTFSSDVLKENISHAGGANECTVTSLLAAVFLRYKALYKNCSGDARFEHGALIARLLEWASSVSDVSSGVCSITLLVHVGNLLVYVGANLGNLLAPRETKVDVSKCYACHANSRSGHRVHSGPSAPPEPAQCHKCHACHAKWKPMSPSTTPAT